MSEGEASASIFSCGVPDLADIFDGRCFHSTGCKRRRLNRHSLEKVDNELLILPREAFQNRYSFSLFSHKTEFYMG